MASYSGITPSSKTDRLYYFDTYVSGLSAVVTEHAIAGVNSYIVTNQTVFHPQGGGQPSDSGAFTFKGEVYEVTRLEEDRERGCIKHYYSHRDDLSGLEGETVSLTIDIGKRLLYAKLHTGGHLIANLVQDVYPQLRGYKGNHFPGGQAYVVFKGSPLPPPKELEEKVNSQLGSIIAEKRAVHVDNDTSPRRVRIEGYESHPCGGTHVKNTEELEGISIRSVRKIKQELKVGYNLPEA
ncbi:MAG: hypothetical protein ACHQUC_05435 [Chlamydiales bacterium]